MPIVLHGHLESPSESDRPLRLSEVTIQASPVVLREIAAFLTSTASAMESEGGIGHVHFRDQWRGWSEADGDLVVADPG